MPVCTMPPESCIAQSTRPATTTTADTPMAMFSPRPPHATALALAASRVFERPWAALKSRSSSKTAPEEKSAMRIS